MWQPQRGRENYDEEDEDPRGWWDAGCGLWLGLGLTEDSRGWMGTATDPTLHLRR